MLGRGQGVVGVSGPLPAEIEINVRSEDERREPLGKANSGTAHVVDSTPAPVARQMKERRIIGKRGGKDKDEDEGGRARGEGETVFSFEFPVPGSEIPNPGDESIRLAGRHAKG